MKCNLSSPAACPPSSPWTGIVRLIAWLVFLGLVWLVALPWAAHREPVARELQRLEQQKIDPSAMYYTELEAMKPILKRLNHQMRSGHFTSHSSVRREQGGKTSLQAISKP